MKNSILVAENDKNLMKKICGHLRGCRFEIFEAYTGDEVYDFIEERDFDIILLDVKLPDADGYSVLRQIRRSKDVPIVMITADDSEGEKILLYDIGADECVSRSISMPLLTAKMQALMKRSKGNVCTKPGVASLCGIEIDSNSHTVKIDGEIVDLTPKEFDLLLCFMENKGRVMSRDTLLSKVWGYDYFGDLRTVDTHIKKLRAKLGDKAVHIKTLIKTGYKFEENV